MSRCSVLRARRTQPRAAALAAAFLLTRAAAAQSPAGAADGAPADGAAIAERAYRLAPFDSLEAGPRREVTRGGTRDDYERARADRRFALRKVEYGSDGLRVVAYVYGPASPAPARPAIVYARGSFVAGDLAPALLLTLHRLADAGYVVVAPQYRGSDGGEGRDEMGGADVADVRNALVLARSTPGVDTGRVFLYGESRGGMMTYQAVRDGAAVRAAAVVGAFTDLDSLLAGDPRSRQAAATVWPRFADERASIVPRRSAAHWPDSLRGAPLLILHGGADRQVSPRQALRLAIALDAAGAPYELHVLAGGSHTLAERAAERDALVVAWFRRHAPSSRP